MCSCCFVFCSFFRDASPEHGPSIATENATRAPSMMWPCYRAGLSTSQSVCSLLHVTLTVLFFLPPFPSTCFPCFSLFSSFFSARGPQLLGGQAAGLIRGRPLPLRISGARDSTCSRGRRTTPAAFLCNAFPRRASSGSVLSGFIWFHVNACIASGRAK